MLSFSLFPDNILYKLSFLIFIYYVIQVPSNFRFVVEQTLREFFKAIQEGRDAEQSWKKSIYKIISRLDDPVPEYFKSPNFLEQLEWPATKNGNMLPITANGTYRLWWKLHRSTTQNTNRILRRIANNNGDVNRSTNNAIEAN